MPNRDCLHRPDGIHRRNDSASAVAPKAGVLIRQALVRSVEDALGHIDQLLLLERKEMDRLTEWRFLFLRSRLGRVEDLVTEMTGDWASKRAG